MFRLVHGNKNIVLLTADNGFISFNTLQQMMPKQIMNLGIAEANTVSYAAGLASCGKIPIVISIATFLVLRAYEQIRNDICLNNKCVKLIGIGPGIYFSKMGASHQAFEDIALMSLLPEMTVICPCCQQEFIDAVSLSICIDGPVYIRQCEENLDFSFLQEQKLQVGKGFILRNGSDVTIISTGSVLNDVLSAEVELRKEGIDAEVIHMPVVKPLDEKLVLDSVAKTGALVVVEEHCVYGGFGSMICMLIAKKFEKIFCFQHVAVENSHQKLFCEKAEAKELYGIGVHDIIKKTKYAVAVKE